MYVVCQYCQYMWPFYSQFCPLFFSLCFSVSLTPAMCVRRPWAVWTCRSILCHLPVTPLMSMLVNLVFTDTLLYNDCIYHVDWFFFFVLVKFQTVHLTTHFRLQFSHAFKSQTDFVLNAWMLHFVIFAWFMFISIFYLVPFCFVFY